MRGYLRSLDPQLPRDVWLLQIGGVANSFGNGIVFPFLAIYLHNVRGFGIATAGIAIAISSAAQLTAGVAMGPIIDRLGRGARSHAGSSSRRSASLLPLVREPWHAYVLLAVEGIGSAAFWPSQSTLISRLTERLHAAFAQQRVTMNLGVGLGGLAGGLIATVDNPTSFTVLFVLDGLTFLAYVGVLGLIHDPGTKPLREGESAGSYRDVLRDRLFLGLWALNFTFVAAGYSLLNLLPPFVRDHGDLNERQIGVVFFNTITIVLAQLPISRWIEAAKDARARAHAAALGRRVARDRRDRLLARGDDGLSSTFFVIVFGIGECFHGPAHQALVGELGTEHARPLLRAALDVVGLGGTVGPAVGGLILAQAPFALWPLAAAVLVVASAGALALERLVPPQLQRIPRAERQPDLVHGQLEPAPAGLGERAGG